MTSQFRSELITVLMEAKFDDPTVVELSDLFNEQAAVGDRVCEKYVVEFIQKAFNNRRASEIEPSTLVTVYSVLHAYMQGSIMSTVLIETDNGKHIDDAQQILDETVNDSDAARQLHKLMDHIGQAESNNKQTQTSNECTCGHLRFEFED